MAEQYYRVYEVTPLNGKRRLLLTTSDRERAIAVAQSILPNEGLKAEAIAGYQVVDEDDVQIFPELASSG